VRRSDLVQLLAGALERAAERLRAKGDEDPWPDDLRARDIVRLLREHGRRLDQSSWSGRKRIRYVVGQGRRPDRASNGLRIRLIKLMPGEAPGARAYGPAHPSRLPARWASIRKPVVDYSNHKLPAAAHMA
jgi:hypothetical protein